MQIGEGGARQHFLPHCLLHLPPRLLLRDLFLFLILVVGHSNLFMFLILVLGQILLFCGGGGFATVEEKVQTVVVVGKGGGERGVLI